MSTTPMPPPFAPTPFILKERYITIDCPFPKYAGLWFEVRMNLSNGELQALREALEELDDRVDVIREHHLSIGDDLDERLNALPEDDHKGRRAVLREGRENQRAYVKALQPIGIERRNLVAPHIRNWNVFEPAADGGEPTLLPVPRDTPESINALPPDVILWLSREVIKAYTGGEGFAASSGTSVPAPEPGNALTSGGPTVAPEPISSPSRRRRKN